MFVNKYPILIFVLLFLQLASKLVAQNNLALNKKYTVSPKPDYRLCADNEDLLQITDGVYEGSDWSKKSTVGWDNPLSIPEIIIDLENNYFVERVVVYTVAGQIGGVKLVKYTTLLVSEDGVNYKLAGYLEVGQEIESLYLNKRKISYILNFKDVNVNARYVKILIQPRGTFVFTDEIEIFGDVKKTEDGGLLPVFFQNASSKNINEKICKRRELIQSLDSVILALKSQNDLLNNQFVQQKLVYTDTLKQKLNKNRLIYISDLDVIKLAKNIQILRSDILFSVYNKPYAILKADPMKVLRKGEMTDFSLPVKNSLKLLMWQNESETFGFNFVNCHSKDLTVAISISNLINKKGKIFPSAKHVLAKYAEYSYSANKGLLSDVLIPVENTLQVIAGDQKEILFTINSTDLMPGSYKLAIGFSVASKEKLYPLKVYSINLNVSAVFISGWDCLNTCNWAYPNLRKDIKECKKQVVEDLKGHYLNVFVVHSSNLPFSSKKYYCQNPFESKLSKKMDLIFDNYPDMNMYLIFFDCEREKREKVFGQWMSKKWKDNYGNWIRQLVVYLKKKGVGCDRFAIYPFDEDFGDDGSYIQFAKYMKSVAPKIKLYANTFGDGPKEFGKYKDLIDIWCLHQDICKKHLNWLSMIRNYNKQVWVYKPLNISKDPLQDYRKMAWWAFSKKLTGIGFWTYAEVGPNQWYNYAKAIDDYSAVYVAKIGEQNHCKIFTSKRWESWRDGIEDYLCLYKIEEEINKIAKTKPKLALKYRIELDDLVSNVLKKANDCDDMCFYKNELTNIVLELNNINTVSSFN